MAPLPAKLECPDKLSCGAAPSKPMGDIYSVMKHRRKIKRRMKTKHLIPASANYTSNKKKNTRNKDSQQFVTGIIFKNTVLLSSVPSFT